MSREFWLEGTVAGVPPLLMPAAHALLQSGHDLREAAGSLTPAHISLKPNGAASIGFHLRHIAGSLDRLLTYAGGQQLSPEQRQALEVEKAEPAEPVAVGVLLDQVDATIEKALAILRRTPESSLLEPRLIGRAQRPTNVLGALFHAAEHTQRHTGQVITTAKLARE